MLEVLFKEMSVRIQDRRSGKGGREGDARMRVVEVGERKEQVRAWRTEVGLCAETTYAIEDGDGGCGMRQMEKMS